MELLPLSVFAQIAAVPVVSQLYLIWSRTSFSRTKEFPCENTPYEVCATRAMISVLAMIFPMVRPLFQPRIWTRN